MRNVGIPRWAFASPGSTADNLQAIAWVGGAAAGLLMSVTLFIVAVFRPWRRITAHLDSKLGGIDLAVNNVPEGTPPMAQQVTWLFAAVETIAVQAGYSLPPKPTAEPRTARTRKTDTHRKKPR